MAVLNPDHLFELADRLRTSHGGAGAPRQVDLRRAISSAYYGVFHAVVTQAADDFVGSTRRDTPRYALVYRSVDHRSLREACEAITKKTLPAKYARYAPRNGFGPDLQAAATAVVELQEKRHLADYDPLYRVLQSDAFFAVLTGRIALDRFRNAPRRLRRSFLSLVVFSPR